MSTSGHSTTTDLCKIECSSYHRSPSKYGYVVIFHLVYCRYLVQLHILVVSFIYFLSAWYYVMVSGILYIWGGME